MPETKKTVSLINRKIQEGKAVVISDREFVDAIHGGRKLGVSEIDVVTTAWNAAISGTAVMLCVPVTERGVFTRARKIWLNGVPGLPGPAPNERLGVVDTQIFAEQPSRNKDADYDGAMLFEDMLRKKRIDVECLSEAGDTYRNSFTIDQLQFARMYIYNCFLDGFPASAETTTQQSYRHLAPLAAGSKILLNKAFGIVIGSGTRCTPGRKAFSLSAEMFGMDPDVMTKEGGADRAAITNLIALAIPVLNEEGLKDLSAWLLSRKFAGQQEDLQDHERDMSRYLKALVLKENFLLTSSDSQTNAGCPDAQEGVNRSKGHRL